jgi:hypothetical protein
LLRRWNGGIDPLKEAGDHWLRRGIFSDRDDVSISLDFLRAGAAQMVCCGHAWNLYKLGHQPTYRNSV